MTNSKSKFDYLDELTSEKKITPVSFEEFVTSPDYCDYQEMYQFWIDEGNSTDLSTQEIVIDGSLGGGKCKTVNSRVSTSLGYLKGSELISRYKASEGFTEADFGVEQPDGSFEKVSHLYREDKTKCVKLTTHFGKPLIATPEHPVLALQQDHPYPRLVKAGELKQGDYILRRKYRHVELNISQKEAIKYFVYGYALGDASYTGEDLRYEGDIAFIEWLSKREALRVDGDPHSVIKAKSPLNRCLYVPGGRSIIADLLTFGQNAYTKSLNELVFCNKARAFCTLMGMLAADGTRESVNSEVHARGQRKSLGVEYNTASQKLAEGLTCLLDYLSIPYHFTVRPASYTYKGEKKQGSYSYRISFSSSFIPRAKEDIRNLYGLLELPKDSRAVRFLTDQEEAEQNLIEISNTRVSDVVSFLRKFKCPHQSPEGCLLCRYGRPRKERRMPQCNVRQAVSKTLRQGYSTFAYARYMEEFRIPSSPITEGTGPNLEAYKDYVYDVIESREDVIEDVFDVTVPSTHLFMSENSVNHNTTYASYRLIYFLYCLFLYGDKVRKYLGVGASSDIYILYFSVSMTQANRSGFKELRNIVDRCKWFQENYPRDKNIDSEIRFPNGFTIIFASSEGHAISLNVVAFILDEANFKKGVGLGMEEEYAAVTQLYSQLIDRQYSRFATPEGLKSLAILISSASYQTSFVEERKNKILGNEHARVVHAVAYKIKPWNYSKETFKVFIGTDTVQPQIVESEKQKEMLIRALGNMDEEHVKQYFVDVPVSLKDPYLTNINLALQNHSGIPTQMRGKLVTNLNLVRESYVNDEYPWFANYQVTLSNQDEIQLEEYIDEKVFFEYCEKYGHLPHCFFLDLSVHGDSGGFTCVRLDDSETKHCTHVFTLEIIPPSFPAATRIRKIQVFMNFVSQYVNVAAFGSDQYQSTELRQDIQADLGLEDIRVSIDSTDMYYLLWLQALVEKKFAMLYYPTLHREIKEAQHDLKKRRVVKAPNSTDDCIQTLVGAHFLATHVEAFTGELPVNIVGRNSVERIARSLGYK